MEGRHMSTGQYPLLLDLYYPDVRKAIQENEELAKFLYGGSGPSFRYQPNYYRLTIRSLEKETCECCGKMVEMYDNLTDRERERGIERVCLDCIASGEFAAKYNVNLCLAQPVSDPARTDEILHRTPSFFSFQDYDWPICCDDYCAFIGDYHSEPVKELGLADDQVRHWQTGGQLEDFEWEHVKETGFGLLFQCLHCHSYVLIVDTD